MRIISQNILNGSIIVDSKLIAKSKEGLFLLVAFTTSDNFKVVDKMVAKLLKLRVFPDDLGRTNLSIGEIDGEIMVASQFTLYGDVLKNNRPSFISSLNKEEAVILYDYFIKKLQESYPHVSSGQFHASMTISLTCDGPFTLILDSKELNYE